MTDGVYQAKWNLHLVIATILLSIALGTLANSNFPILQQFLIVEIALILQVAIIVILLFLRYPFGALSAYLYVASWKDIPFLSDINPLIPTGVVIGILLLNVVSPNRVMEVRSHQALNWQGISFILLVGFVLYGIVNSIALSDQLGIQKALRFLVFSVPIYLIVWSLFSSSDSVKKFLITSIVAGGVFSLLILINGLLSQNSDPFFIGALGFEENRIVAGRTTGIALIFSLSYFLFHKQSFSKRIIALVVILISASALLFAYSRGAIVSALLVCSVLLYVSPSHNRWMPWMRLGGLLALILTASTALMESSWGYLLSRFDSVIDVSASERLEFYRTGIDNFMANPIWGIGLSNFQAYSPFYEVFFRTYPHNIVIEVLAETGLIGGILFFFPLVYTVWLGVRNLAVRDKYQPEELFLWVSCFAAFMFFLASAMLSGDIQINRNIWLFVFLLWRLNSRMSVES